MTRNFQLATAIVCVGILAGLYLNTRGHRKLAEMEARNVAATPNPSTPASLSATTTMVNTPTPRPPLPKSKAEIIAALASRGYKLEPFAPSQPLANVDGYRVAGIPAAVAFTERGGGVVMVDVAAMAAGDRKNGPLLLDFAEIVGEVSTGRSRDTTRQAIAQTMNAIGKTPGRLSCTFGAGKDRFRLEATRHNGGYSFAFMAERVEPPAGEARGEM